MRADQARALTVNTDAPFHVLPQNWSALQVFFACSTQWRVSAQGLYLGLDYASVEAVMRMFDSQNLPDLFSRVRILEHAALDAMRKLKR